MHRLLSGFFLILMASTCLQAQKIIVGAEQTENYLPIIKNKKIALVVNQTSLINKTHIVDSLKRLGVDISVIFAPEHGFRGNASAGTTVSNGKDEKTGIRIISLYGSHKKPYPEDLKGVQYVVFDIQDVGVRFYTYISTMHYVMEACAENKIPFMILDRPNPNGHFIDGPILDTAYRSFIGMHPIPIVHGCTVAELAQMINGESWLKSGIRCELKTITCKNYRHSSSYELPVRPSPNLQTQSSVYLYPSLGLFEGTVISIGQGTTLPYQCFGSVAFDWGNLKFTPVSIPGVAEKPKFQNFECTGFDLTWYGNNRAEKAAEINLNWLIVSYRNSKNQKQFFTDFFEKLSGTAELRKQIISGKSALEIKQSWQAGLDKFQIIRKKYLLYPL